MCVGNRGGQWDWVVWGLSFVGKKLWGWRGGGRSEVGEWSGARWEYGAGWRVEWGRGGRVEWGGWVRE